MSAQKVNYSAELTAQIVTSYESGATLEQIAQESGKSVRSLRAKLSQLGVYKTTGAVARKATGVTREKIVWAIEAKLNMPEGSLSSLTTAKKGELEALLQAVK